MLCGLAGVALALSACAGSNSTTSGKPAARPSSSAGASSPIIYHAQLSGTANRPPGAPAGAGTAIVALHRGAVLCWRFAHLHGFTAATGASVNQGAAGATGPVVAALSTGSRLRHRGCRLLGAAASDALRRDPSGYYVEVASRQYPAGAVRGQL